MVQLPINFQAWGSTYPEEIIVHEWLHTVEGFYRGFGYAVPSLHDAEKYGYKPDGNGSWHRWYEDYMQNKVWNGTKYVGVPSDAWENHIPTGLVYVSAPALPKAISPVNSSREISPDPAFSWQSVPDALWYRLQVSDNSLFSTTLIDRWISKTFYAAIAFVNNTNYYWRFKAMNAAGASNWSKKGHFTTVLDNWMPNDGTAIRFDGVNDHIRVKREIQDDFTLEAWIKTNSSRNGWNFYDGNGLIYADLAGGYGNDFGTSILNEKFAFGTGNPDTTIQSTTTVATGEWVHVAAVRVRSTGTIKVFVNGIEEKSQSTGNTNPLSEPVYIDIGGNMVDRRCFDGLIDEVRIWNVARTQDQVRKDMHRRLEGTEEGLVGYWRFDEGRGTTAQDISGNNNEGILWFGPTWTFSTTPFGPGSSDSQVVVSPGIVNFTDCNLGVNFTTKSETDTFVVTMIDRSPIGVQPSISENAAQRFWIVRKYGNGTFDADLTFTFNTGFITQKEIETPGNLKLFVRDSNSDSNWEMISSAIDATTNTVTFSGITRYGQFSIASIEKGKIYGYILNTKSVPVKYANIRLEGESTKIMKTTKSDANGYFEFADLDDDTYLLIGRKSGYKRIRERITIENEEEKVNIIMKIK